MGVILVLFCTFTLVIGSAGAKYPDYQTGFDEWLAGEGDFANWKMTGITLNADGELVLDQTAATWETDPYAPDYYYDEIYFYNGASYWVGQATSRKIRPGFDFEELIASWNADTPPGTWAEVLVRARLDSRWTKWYNLGVWAGDSDTIQRHSVRQQGDDDGYVAIDTLKISDEKALVRAYQLSVRLFSEDGAAVPSVRYLSAAYSTKPVRKHELVEGNPAHWGIRLDVPECSQMVYPDGGNTWCSPTSTAMVVSYYTDYTGPCEPVVRQAKDGVYDGVYDAYGNWPFNTAYAATYGLQGSVRRFTSMKEVEAWVAQGVPVVISFAWSKNDLTGAPIPSSSGHLSVVVGFDEDGNPIVNDPAAASDEEVQRTYLRSELESLWLGHTGGTVYLIKPIHPSES
jgi:hypothetical protein